MDRGQPRYLITRNMTTQVNSMPPIMMNLSCVARLSISLITVFDSPNILATSSIFLWVPCAEPKQQWSHVRLGYNSHKMFRIIPTLHVHPSSSDFTRRRVPTPSLTNYSVTSFSWLNNRHTLIRGGLKQNQEEHLLPGNKESPSC